MPQIRFGIILLFCGCYLSLLAQGPTGDYIIIDTVTYIGVNLKGGSDVENEIPGLPGSAWRFMAYYPENQLLREETRLFIPGEVRSLNAWMQNGQIYVGVKRTDNSFDLFHYSLK